MNLISLNRTGIVRGLAWSTAGLVIAGFAARWIVIATGHDKLFGMLRLLDLDIEGNLPSFFSAAILLMAALLLGAISALKRKAADPEATRWTVLAGGFLFMAADEAAAIHELLVEPMRAALGARDVSVLYFAWVVPAIVLVVGLGFYFLGFLRRLPPGTRRQFVWAAIIYLSGAIGFEMLGGRYWALHAEAHDLTYNALTAIEEGLEMAGVVMFIRTLLAYISQHCSDLQIRID
jgi:hypothetical protein